MNNKDKLHLEKLLNSEDEKQVAETLLYIVYNVKDISWSEEVFMRMANNFNGDICGLALTCIGHLARINGKIDKGKVIPFLKEKMENSNEVISSRAEDALDDINVFT
ncbi:hypothetical protein [Escherichia sp. TW09308]|uniref:hypothetical protein n=1 Tax=Escherichia sp. TW09308 TaxID=754331 RepID=UPI0002482949|nr:hypothetical protein [Escherichia sp. TW09308]